jgi:D-beta-D-heptose 7-phosphate kinase/D-beta-D-heptose 1-phosphate adenosyltransferase
MEAALDQANAVIVGDYGKGVVTQKLLDALRRSCSKRRVWLSLDPKPAHALNLKGLSLLTPNRREAFQLAGLTDSTRSPHPMEDRQLLKAADHLIQQLCPAVLLITLGELGMLLCLKGQAPIHFETVARQVFDVSGAGDTVIASFTMAMVAGASPAEAAVFSNHAAGVVVGKIGTATVAPNELRQSFSHR